MQIKWRKKKVGKRPKEVTQKNKVKWADVCYKTTTPSVSLPWSLSSPSIPNAGFTSLVSSVTIPCASSHENPLGRHNTATRFLLQLPCEKGFGGGGPSGTTDLWAWLRICSIVVMFRSRSWGEGKFFLRKLKDVIEETQGKLTRIW